MLDEMNEENGTILLPGSHKAAVNPSVPGVHDPMTQHPAEQRATGKAGSVLIIDSRLWHCIPPNPTATSRVAFAVRYAPWFLDTSVVMPGSAARGRIVDGAGRPLDVGGNHAGIPLGNPSQPPMPPSVFKKLVEAGGGAEQTAALYEHWQPPISRPPTSPTAALAATGVLPDGSELLPPHGALDVTEACDAMKTLGYSVLRAAHAVEASDAGTKSLAEPFFMRSVAAAGYLDAPQVLALAGKCLGAFYRICDVQSDVQPDTVVGLARAWPHQLGIAPCVFDPPLSRLHNEATLVLHAHFAHSPCKLLVQPLDDPTCEPQTLSLGRGDVVMLDSRVRVRWSAESNVSLHGGSIMSPPMAPPATVTVPAIRVSFSPWWFDASVLAEGSIHRRRVLEAFIAGRGPKPPPPRPPLKLAELSNP